MKAAAAFPAQVGGKKTAGARLAAIQARLAPEPGFIGSSGAGAENPKCLQVRVVSVVGVRVVDLCDFLLLLSLFFQAPNRLFLRFGPVRKFIVSHSKSLWIVVFDELVRFLPKFLSLGEFLGVGVALAVFGDIAEEAALDLQTGILESSSVRSSSEDG